MKKLTSIALLIVFLGINTQAKIETVIGSVSLAQNANLPNFIPETTDSEIIISRDQYVISYSRERRAPNWVAWKLESQDLGGVDRTKEFSRDPDLEKYLSQTGSGTVVDPTDYTGSCFDRGHQVPSGDRTDTKINNEETFLTSNIIPQTPYLNRVIWEHLEQHTRDLVKKQHKKAYVIAGPIYDEDFGAIGPHHDIPVPSKDFKIVLLLDANQGPADIDASTEAIVVIMPNVNKDGSKPTVGSCKMDDMTSSDRNDWQQYQTTIVEVQRLTGLQFTDR